MESEDEEPEQGVLEPDTQLWPTLPPTIIQAIANQPTARGGRDNFIAGNIYFVFYAKSLLQGHTPQWKEKESRLKNGFSTHKDREELWENTILRKFTGFDPDEILLKDPLFYHCPKCVDAHKM